MITYPFTIYPGCMNINSRIAIAYRQMIKGLRSAAMYRGSQVQRGEFSCKSVDVETCKAKYEEMANKGSSPDKKFEPKSQLTVAVRSTTRKERKQLVSKWQSGESIFSKSHRGGVIKFKSGSKTPFTDHVPSTIKSEATPADVVRCSFCKKVVPLVEATIGTKLRKTVNDIIVENPPFDPHIETLMVHYQDKKIACPACCLEIKPTMEKDSDGNVLVIGGVPVIKRSNQKWIETEG